MALLTDFAEMLPGLIIGLLMVGGLLTYIYKRHAETWNLLSTPYHQPWQTPKTVKHLRSLVLYSPKQPLRSYHGVISIGLHKNGLALKPIAWIVPFHTPLFIPYKDIRGWQQTWYLDSKSIELELAQAPDLRIIMPRSQVEWIRDNGGFQVKVSDQPPPHKQWPWASFASSLIFAAMGLSFGAAYMLGLFPNAAT